MRFSIDTQQDILSRWTGGLLKRMQSVSNVNLMTFETIERIRAVDSAYTFYKKSTETGWGYLKSFIPFTAAYSFRSLYHNRVIKACDKLKELQNKVIQLEKEEAAKKIPRRSSAPASLQFVYSSPINSFNNKKDTRRNSFNFTHQSPFYSKSPSLFY
jgi:hypothetical protein